MNVSISRLRQGLLRVSRRWSGALPALILAGLWAFFAACGHKTDATQKVCKIDSDCPSTSQCLPSGHCGCPDNAETCPLDAGEPDAGVDAGTDAGETDGGDADAGADAGASVELTSIAITPADPNLALGTTLQLSAMGTFSDASKLDLTSTVTWSSSDLAVATITAAGEIHTVSAGTATITASDGSVSGTTHLTVSPAIISSVAVTPIMATVVAGDTQQLRAMATLTDGTMRDVTNTAMWTTSAATIATVSATGLVQSLTMGSVTITATSADVNGSAAITVAASVLRSIVITPGNPAVAAGTTMQLTATGVYSDGSTHDVTTQSSWSSNTESRVTVSGGLVRGVSPGAASVTATSDGVSAQVTVTVSPALLQSIAIGPNPAVVPLGGSLQLTATGSYSDGTTQNLTSSVTWTSLATAVATISPAGVLQGRTLGGTNVTAISAGVTGTLAITVGPPAVLSMTVAPSSPTVALGGNLLLIATGTMTNGSVQPLTTQVSWTTSDSSKVSVTSSGRITGVARGTATVTATAGTVVVNVPVTVGPAALASIAIQPADTSLPIGEHVTLSATGTLTDGTTNSITSQVSWASNDPSVAIVVGGGTSTVQVIALRLGTVTLTADLNGVAGTTHVTVLPAAPVELTISPADSTVALGAPLRLVVTGRMSDNSTLDETSSVTWESSDASVAVATSSGAVQTLSTGTAVITASLGDVSTTTTITVTPAELVSIAVGPANASVVAGSTLQLTAIGTYTDATTRNLAALATWSSSNTTFATVSSGGLLSGRAQGTVTITATFGTISGSANVVVLGPRLVSLAIGPASPSVPVGASIPLTATGTYSDTSTQDLTSFVVWSSANTAIATVSSAGVLSGKVQGTVSITATSGAISTTAVSTVSAPVLSSINVTPATNALALGLSRQLTATGVLSDGTSQDLTTQVTWASESASIATVSGVGLVQSRAQGVATITATLGLLAGSAAVTVGPAELLSLGISPRNQTIPAGTTVQLTASGDYTDAVLRDVSAVATWSSSDPTRATVTTTGLVRGIVKGAVTITASVGGVVSTVQVTVTDPVLSSLVLSPSSASVPLGSPQQLTATGTFSDGSQRDVTPSTTWTSGSPAIATVTPGGLVQTKAEGSAIITGTNAGIPATALITVAPAALAALTLSPADQTIALGRTQQMVATGTYTDGSTRTLTAQATWSSSVLAVATISATGLVQSSALGTATLTGAVGSVSATTTLTVSAPSIVSVAVTPASPTIALGNNLQFTAKGTYTNGTVVDITGTAAWNASNTAVATTSSDGFVQTHQQGAVTLTASLDGVSGTTQVTVGAPVLASLAIAPASKTIALGTSQQFVATGTLTDHSTRDLSATVTWASNSMNATVSSTGLVHGAVQGNATISATSGAFSATAAVTVAPPDLVSIAVTPLNGSMPLGRTLQLAATGTFTDGSSSALPAGGLIWTSSNNMVALALSTGVAQSFGQGTAVITATYGQISGSASVTVTAPNLVSIVVTPPSSSIALGNSVALTATGTYTDATTANISSQVVWTPGNASVITIGLTGLAQSHLMGTTSATASYAGVTGSANVTVTAAVLASVALSPSTPLLPLGTTQTLVATGTMTDGTTQNVTAQVTQWSSSSPTNASVVAGLVTAKVKGTAIISATVNGIVGSTTVTVVDAVLSLISVTPTTPTVALGDTVQLVATGMFTDGSTQVMTSTVAWSSGTLAKATVSAGGLVLTKALGAVVITATSGTVSGSTTVTVGAPRLVSIAVTPGSPIVPLGSTLQLTATGTYSDASTQVLSGATWASDNTARATVSTSGLATARALGTANITATLSGVTGTVPLSVTTAALVSLAITPANPAVAQGLSQQFAVTGTYTDASMLNLTSSATWSSSNAAVATAAAGGLVSSTGQGAATISASYQGFIASTQLTVGAPTLVSITVTPSSQNVPIGLTRQFVATGIYTAGPTKNLTAEVTWASSTPAFSSITAGGLATALTRGTTTITATQGSVTGSAQLTVVGEALVSIAVTPANPNISLGNTQQMVATGTYTNATSKAITGQVVWTSSNTSRATVTGVGLVSSVAEGSVTISAALGSVSGSTTLTIGSISLVSIAIAPTAPTIALGLTTQFSATGTYSDSSTQNITSQVAWTSGNPATATVSASGFAQSNATGTSTITATLGAVSSSTVLTVAAANLVSIAVTPASPTIALGTSTQLIATGTYTDATTAVITGTAAWTTSSAPTATVAAGVVTSHATGPATITATVSGISGSTVVTVGAATVVSLALTPQSPTIALGRTQQMSVVGTYTDGTTQTLTSTVAWSSSNPATATISSGGLAQSLAQGTTTLQATYGSVSASTTLTVGAKVLVSIAVTPGTSTIAAGNSVQLTATGTYSDATTQDLSSTATWTSSAPAVASVSATGLVHGNTQGNNVIITATQSGVSGTATVNGTAAVLASIAIAPSNKTTALGTTVQYTATGTMTDGTVTDVSSTVVWSSSSTSVATISAAGLATSKATGSTSITATKGAVTASTPLTVGQATLVSIALSPTNPTIALGNSQQLVATGTYTDATTQVITASADWSSSNAAKATVSAAGLVLSKAQGTTTITATKDGISQSTLVTVGAPLLLSIAVTPTGQSIPKGNTLQLVATGTYTDAVPRDVTSTATWTTSASSVATVSGGVVQSVNAGSATITATVGAIAGSTGVSVTSASLLSIAVTPGTSSIALGQTKQLLATGTLTDGTTPNLTSVATWTSSNTAIATVSASGLVTSKSQGTVTLTATSGAVLGTATVTITDPILVSLAVSPTSATIALGNSQQVVATGTLSDATTSVLTSSATWTTSNPAVATVVGGLVQSRGAGTATITASSGGFTAQTSVTVGGAALVSLAITPANQSIALGNTLQLTATGTLTDGTTPNLSNSVTWTSSNTAFATISGTGLLTSKGAGSVTVTASQGSVSTTTQVTIGVATLVSIAVTPINQTVALGNSLQLAAVGTYTDNTTQPLTGTVAWTSSAGSFATVTPGGLVQTHATGSTTISATLGAVSGSTTVTVGAATLVSLAITPANHTISLGSTLQLTATGTYTDSTTRPLTSSVVWSSGAPSGATVSSTGLVTSFAVGPVTITAASGTVTTSTQVTVSTAGLVSIAVSPSAPTLALGSGVQLTATGTYTDNSTQVITGQVTWASNLPGIVTVSATGLVQSHGQGTATVTASQGAISTSVQIVVGAPTLVSLSIAPSSSTIPLGTSKAFVATGTYTDGTTTNLSASVTWSSSTPAVASISAAGLAQSLTLGSSTIGAVLNGVSSTASLIVTNPAVVSIVVTPSGNTIPKGTNQAMIATGTFTDGSTSVITGQVSWTSNNATVATIDAAGSAHAAGQGVVTLTATSGTASGSAQLSVGPAALLSLAVTPSPLSITLGLSRQLIATGTYSDGTSTNVASQVAWASSNTGVATVTSLGNVVSNHQGTATITATLNGIGGSTELTVTPPTLVSLAIVPASKTIALGTILQLTATGTFTDGTTGDITTGVQWSSSSPLTAVVTTGGLVQSLSQGVTTITADSNGVSSTAQVTVGPPALTAITVTPGGRTIPNGTNLQLAAVGTYTNATTATITNSVTWTTSSPSMATVSATGLVTATGGGSVTLTATQSGVSSSVQLTVLPQSLVSLTPMPGSQSIPLGTSLQLTAQGLLSDGSTIDLSLVSTWTSSNTSFASVNSAGLVQSRAQGVVTITVTDSGITGSTQVTVTPAALNSIDIGPANAQVAAGTSLSLSATGNYTDGSTRDLTTLVTWSSSSTAKATIDTFGVARGVSPGIVTITAVSGTVTGSAQLTVTLPVLQAIAITPAAAKFPRNQNFQMTATGTYSDGSTQDVTSLVTWASSNPAVATITASGGVARGIAVGTVTLTATSDAISATTTLEIKAGSLQSITITPNNATIALGLTSAMTATGNLSDGTTLPLTSLVTWSASPANFGTITPAGLLQTVGQGLVTITATFGAVSGTGRMTVVAPTVSSVSISPAAPLIAKGSLQQLQAIATYTDGSTTNVTSSATWTSSVPAVATVGGSTGLARAFTTGTTTISATALSKTGTATLTVTSAAIASLAISPQNQTIALGYTQTLLANGTLTDGTTQDVTAQVTWTSSDPQVATVTGGVVQSLLRGTVTITASFGAISASTQMTVGDPVLVSIAVTPANSSLPLGLNVQMAASGTYSDNSTAPLVANTLLWTTGNGLIATVTSGFVRSKALGVTTISAALGNISGSTQITVADPLLVSLAISPSNGGTIPVGNSLTLSVSGTYTDGTVKDLTSAATWTSSTPAFASVTQGQVLAKAAGTTTITASSGGFASQVPVAVTPAALLSIAVTPASQSIALGLTGQVTATGTYTDGSTRNITTTVGWGTSDGNIASISVAGLITTSGQGTVGVTAALPGVTSGTAQITVTAPILLSIAVTPASQSLAVGRDLQLTATGTLSNGVTQVLTGSVSWSSSNTAFGTVSAAGLVHAVAEGFMTASAVLNGVTGSAPVNIIPAALVSLSLTPGDSSLPKGSSLQFTATGTYSDGHTANLSSQVAWLSSDSPVASVSSVGLLQSVREGITHVSATMGGFTTGADVTVGPAVLLRVDLVANPATPISVPQGLTTQLNATGTYTDGTQVDLTSSAIWTSSATGIATVSNGFVQTKAQGTTVVTATYGGKSGSVSIVVTTPVLSSISVTPGSPSVPLGLTTLTLAATGVYSNGAEVTLTNQVTWESTSPFVATVNSNGAVVTHAGGSTIIYASFNGASGFTPVTVGPPLLQSLTIVEDGDTIPLGTTTNLQAIASWSDGTTSPIYDALWSSDNAAIATVSAAGTFHALGLGLVGVSVTAQNVTGTAAIMVGNATLSRISIVPATASVPLGATLQLTALGTYTDSTTVDLTGTAAWMSNNTGTATVTASGGLLLAKALGSVTATATIGDVSGAAAVTVIAHAPRALVVTPTGTSIPFGANQQMSASLIYTDGIQTDVTSLVSWSSSATGVASVDGLGLVRTVSLGQVILQAVYTVSGVTLSDAATLTIGAATISSITITPSNQRVPLGKTLQMKAKGNLTDGTTTDITSQVTWASGASIIATLSPTGSLHAVAEGDTSLTATLGSIVGTTPLKVIAADLVSIAISPTNPNIPIPTVVQVIATGTYTDGTTRDLTLSATWESSNSSIAYISRATPGQIYLQSVAQGIITLSASTASVTSGTIIGSTVVTVGSVALQSIAITPATPTVPLGATQDLVANGTYTNGSVSPVSTGLTWTSSNTAVATVSSSGAVTGVALGTATITATSGAVSGSTVVTVGQPIIASIEITPATVTLAAGLTQQLTAIAVKTDGTTTNVTSQLNWSSGNALIASVSSSGGLAQAVSIGQVVITGTDPVTHLSDTVAVTVVGRQLVSIQLMFANQESAPPICGSTTYQVLLGEELHLVAFGRYSDGAVSDLTAQATWTSSNTAIGVFVDAGLLRTVVPSNSGTTTVTAAISGVSGSAVVTTHE